MNQPSKRAIKSLVLTLRHKLEDDITIQLKRYGFAGERWLPLERLAHIQADDQATIDYYRLHAALEQHLRRIDADPPTATPKQRAEAVDWFVREVAYTHLNRLVALKDQEVRGLIPEIITTRDAYGGRSRGHYDYRNAHPDAARGADDALPAAIRHVSRQVYAEFKLLFDVGDPSVGRRPPVDSILWPSTPVLKECIALINGLDAAAGNDVAVAGGTSQVAGGKSQALTPRPDPLTSAPLTSDPLSLWQEDEIIGWIYQFYNAEQKEAIRKRGKPQRPAEVAAINQFFTPRWIVKFLVDNTLGRLWLEMHPNSPRVRAKCDYLVPEPSGGGDKETSRQGGGEERQFELDLDSPINNPKAPARRAAKRPQDIRLIDPACGTMHFGHYAFEVFEEIYRDAREQGWVTGVDALADGDIPAAILRYNLFGVDIDLRAVQLAGLSLFIKAKTANPDAHITHLNLVVADAVLPADGVRQRFLDQYKGDKVVQQAVATVLDEMANVAEVGSLLRVEERLRSILAKAGHVAVEGLDPRQQLELPGLDYTGRQLTLAEATGAAPEEWEAHYTLERLLDDLRAFAAKALQTHDLNAQLFAEEAEKSIHLLDVFLNDYDIVVMNPPYGRTLENAHAYLTEVYPATKNDLYMAFVERAQDLIKGSGFVGALVSKTFFTLEIGRELRKRILLAKSEIVTCLDLGIGVLDDATVETTAFVFGMPKVAASGRIGFVDLLTIADQEQGFARFLFTGEFGYWPAQAHIERLPGEAFIYGLPPSVERLFSKYPPLDLGAYTRVYGDTMWDSKVDQIAYVRSGLVPPNYAQFVHYHWETPTKESSAWIGLAKGGDYQTYYGDIDYAIYWKNNGQDAKRYSAEHYGSASRYIKNEQLFFKEGVTYSRISSVGMSGRYLPKECIFSEKGPAILPGESAATWYLLAFVNSKLVKYLADAIHPGRSYEVLHIATIPFSRPIPGVANEISDLATAIWSHKSKWDTGNELCTRFDVPWLVQASRRTLLAGFPDLLPTNSLIHQSTTLASLLDIALAVETAADTRLQQLQAEIDEAVYDLYEITPADRALIERELGDRPPELVWPQMEGKPDKDKRLEYVRRLVSWCLLQALKEKRDGLLPLVPVASQETALQAVRRGLEAEFGEQAAFVMEDDIKRLVGKSIADWLDGDFVKWHTKVYKSRPVIWHLASPRNSFGCFLYIHKLDSDTLRKVQTLYLWPFRRAVQAELETARHAQQAGERAASGRIDQAEATLDDLAEFEKRLLRVIQAEVTCDIPDWAEGPYRNGVYDPVLDDGVKVNIEPLQAAEVLRYRKMV